MAGRDVVVRDLHVGTVVIDLHTLLAERAQAWVGR
jgi:hypothetical protein